MNALSSADERFTFRTPTSPWITVGQVGAALAASMGIGRFVYTPVLPLMEAQAGLTPSAGAALATANYLGYLIGALAGIVLPGMMRSAATLRFSLLVLTLTLALMPVASNETFWGVLRFIAGVTSALVFVVAVGAMHFHLSGHAAHLSGWAFGGIGAGIALSGLVVLILRSMSTWEAVWWAAALLTLICTLAAWTLTPERAPMAPTVERRKSPKRKRRWFSMLFISYSLERRIHHRRHFSRRSDRPHRRQLRRQWRLGDRRAGGATVRSTLGVARPAMVSPDPAGDRPRRSGRRHCAAGGGRRHLAA